MRGLDIHLGDISRASIFNTFSAARSTESVIDLVMPVCCLSQKDWSLLVEKLGCYEFSYLIS